MRRCNDCYAVAIVHLNNYLLNMNATQLRLETIRLTKLQSNAGCVFLLTYRCLAQTRPISAF